MQSPGKPSFAVSSQGAAIADARPLTGTKFPLVLMSHGYGGWNTQFSNLAEHIASRGYVVVSIDHNDQKADGVASFLLSFGNVLIDRTLDQRQVLAQVSKDVQVRRAPFLDLVDLKNVGLIGYSMGGYGAIHTAGARRLRICSDTSLSNIRTARSRTSGENLFLVVIVAPSQRWEPLENLKPDRIGRQGVAEAAVISLGRMKVDWIGEEGGLA